MPHRRSLAIFVVAATLACCVSADITASAPPLQSKPERLVPPAPILTAPNELQGLRAGRPGHKNCPHCNLQGGNLSGMDLSHANLAGADLTRANLAGAILDGAILIGAKLVRANLDRASLRRSDGRPANLTMADLSGASLREAVLDGALFLYADVTCTDFSRTDVRLAHFGPHVFVKPQSPCRPSFRDARLSCELRGDWDRFDLTGARRPECAASASAGTQYYCGAVLPSGLTTAVYVATNGTDSDACGATQSAPCLTIQQGVTNCNGANCGVLVAYGSYTQTATVNLPDGIAVYGGCSMLPTPNPLFTSLVIAPAGGEPAFSITQTHNPTLLQGFSVVATPATAVSSPASIGILSLENWALTLSYMTIAAARGATGATGAAGAAGNAGADAGVPPSAGSNAACTDGAGGAGAPAQITTQPDTVCCNILCEAQCYPPATFNPVAPGTVGTPGSTGQSAAGGPASQGVIYGCGTTERPGPAGDGVNGGTGACGTAGGASGNVLGSISSGVWSPSAGTAGGPGGTGGGGGGGGSGGGCAYITCFNASEPYNGLPGGGGGSGGCGGGGGMAGVMGGASIALLVDGGSVTISNSTLTGGTGGNGGDGGASGTGGTGGTGAVSFSQNPCNDQGGSGGTGGNGGTGGSGGGGGAGNGGPAITIASVGAVVTIDATANLFVGRAGAPGSGGAGCTGASGANGIAGVAVIQQNY